MSANEPEECNACSGTGRCPNCLGTNYGFTPRLAAALLDRVLGIIEDIMPEGTVWTCDVSSDCPLGIPYEETRQRVAAAIADADLPKCARYVTGKPFASLTEFLAALDATASVWDTITQHCLPTAFLTNWPYRQLKISWQRFVRKEQR